MAIVPIIVHVAIAMNIINIFVEEVIIIFSCIISLSRSTNNYELPKALNYFYRTRTYKLLKPLLHSMQKSMLSVLTTKHHSTLSCSILQVAVPMS